MISDDKHEQVIEMLARLEERQNAIHKDVKTIRDCKVKLEERVLALENRNTYVNGAFAVILFLVGAGRLYDLLTYFWH